MTKHTYMSEYQKKANDTAIYPESHKVLYPALGLAGEAGEVANKVKKFFRDGYDQETFEQKKIEVASEIGDVLWYCAALARDIGFDLDTIAKENISKLRSRKKRGTIGGEGDNR